MFLKGVTFVKILFVWNLVVNTFLFLLWGMFLQAFWLVFPAAFAFRFLLFIHFMFFLLALWLALAFWTFLPLLTFRFRDWWLSTLVNCYIHLFHLFWQSTSDPRIFSGLFRLSSLFRLPNQQSLNEADKLVARFTGKFLNSFLKRYHRIPDVSPLRELRMTFYLLVCFYLFILPNIIVID